MSARPTSPRRSAVVRPDSHRRMAAGLRSAGASTARGAPGERQRVATETVTQASCPTAGGDGERVAEGVADVVPDEVSDGVPVLVPVVAGADGAGVAGVGVRPGSPGPAHPAPECR